MQDENKVKEKPILFSGPLVSAILAGKKTVTRRVVRPQPTEVLPGVWAWATDGIAVTCSNHEFPPKGARPCPHGAPGDTLWVREAWQAPGAFSKHEMGHVFYRADSAGGRSPCGCKWRSSTHMPRWASRISLRIADVRAERLHDMTAEHGGNDEARLEGIELRRGPHGRALHDGVPLSFEGGLWCGEFARLWDEINGKRPGASWGANPFVWRIEFEVMK